MTLYDQFVGAIGNGVDLSEGEQQRAASIAGRIRGYSDEKHYAFFKALLTLPIRDLLILGVYHGRDVAFILDLAKQRQGTLPLLVIGVDKFNDEACADWPEEKRGMTWKEAGFGEPPSGPIADRNIRAVTHPLPDHIRRTIFRTDDAEFLKSTSLLFDAVYLDTSHDYATVSRQCQQVQRVLRPGAIICGDDYSDTSNAPGGSWGVKKAVAESFTDHIVFANWIWVSSLSRLRQPVTA